MREETEHVRQLLVAHKRAERSSTGWCGSLRPPHRAAHRALEATTQRPSTAGQGSGGRASHERSPSSTTQRRPSRSTERTRARHDLGRQPLGVATGERRDHRAARRCPARRSWPMSESAAAPLHRPDAREGCAHGELFRGRCVDRARHQRRYQAARLGAESALQKRAQ